MMVHRSTEENTVAFLQTNVTDFIEPPNWPPNSLNLNPVDCLIWDAVLHLVHYQQMKVIDH